jgi:hypothetical protein
MFENLDARMKSLDTLDMGLLKLAVLVGTIIIVKIVPQLLDIGFVPLLVLLIAFAARPAYRFWKAK